MLKFVSRFNVIQVLLLSLGIFFIFYIAKLSFDGLLNTRMSFLSQYLSRHGNPALIKYSIIPRMIADSVKALIPQDACVETSHLSLDNLLSFRYYLYPIKLVIPEANDFNNQPRRCNGHYFIDLTRQIQNPPDNWRKIDLPKRANLYVIGDSPLNIQGQLPSPSPSPFSVPAYYIFQISIVVIGCFLLSSFFPHVGNLPLSGKLGGGYLLGFVGVTLSFWLLSLLRVPLTDLLVYAGLAVMVLMSYLFMRKQGRSLARMFFSKQPIISDVLFDMVGLAVIIFYFFLIVSYPIGISDEVHIWILKSKIFFDLRVLNFDYTEIITNYYPVFWPLYLTLQFIFTKGDHDQIAKWTSAFIFLSSLGLMKSIAISLGLGKKTSWLVVLVFLIYFHHWTFFTALAENIYIALVLLSVAFFIDWLKSKSVGSLYATALSLVALCGVKFEGTVVVVLFFIAFILSQKPKLNELWPGMKLILPLSIAFIMQPLWLTWLDFHNAHYSIFHLRREATPENFLAILQMTMIYLSNSRITVMIILLAVFFPCLVRNSRPWSQAERFLLCLICGLILFAYSAGLCWTNSYFREYYPEVLLRLVSRAMPLVVVLWMSRNLYLTEYTRTE